MVDDAPSGMGERTAVHRGPRPPWRLAGGVKVRGFGAVAGPPTEDELALWGYLSARWPDEFPADGPPPPPPAGPWEAVLRLLAELTADQLQSLKLYAIPEAQRRIGVDTRVLVEG